MDRHLHAVPAKGTPPSPLTDRQAEVLRFIEHRLQEQGYPPTLREIGEELGIRSVNGVNDHLQALIRKGYITRTEGRSRAVQVTQSLGNAVRMAWPPSTTVEVPLLGRVAAGQPILAVEEAEGTVVIDSVLIGNAKKVYALRVVGESMIDDGILDGDYIFVRKQPHAEQGAIVVAMVDGEATVKRFFHEGDTVRLQPANAAMKPILIAKSAFRETQILGTVVGVYRKV